MRMEAVWGCIKLLGCLVLPGLAWGWILPSRRDLQGSAIQRAFVKLAEVSFISLLLTLLLVVLLAEFGLFRRGMLWSILGSTSLAGLALAWCRDRDRLRLHVAQSRPGVALLGIGLLILLVLPGRGEWLVGGWDPGVYVNEGVHLSRSGTFYPEALPAYRVLARHGVELLSRNMQGFQEAFPGIPLDPRTGAFSFYFYRLSVAWHALGALCCGLPGALRAPGAAMLLAVILLAGLLAATRVRMGQLAVILLLFCAHPFILYHSHTPASEGLELVLAFGVAYAWCRRSNHVAYVALLAGGLLAAGINRPSFIFFGGLLVFLTAVLDFRRADRKRVACERIAMLFGLAAAIWYYRAVTPQSVVKIAHVYVFLLRGVVSLAGTAVCIDLLAASSAVRALATRPRAGQLRLAAVVGLASLAALLYRLDPRSAWELRTNAGVLIEYSGWPLACLVGAGGVLWLLGIPKRTWAAHLHFWLVFLSLVGLLTLARKSVAELYPWATKRYLFFAPAVGALLGSLPIAALWQRGPSGALRVFRVLAGIALLAIALAPRARLIYHAWDRTEYDGVSVVLEKVADCVPNGDILVVDHFLWATPLCLTYGCQALSGVNLWSADTEKVDLAVKFIRQLRTDGYAIWLLTSSPDGIAVFPPALHDAKPAQSFPAVTYQRMQHHPRARDFELTRRVKELRLYEWKGNKAE